jgi:hypothetical protein
MIPLGFSYFPFLVLASVPRNSESVPAHVSFVDYVHSIFLCFILFISSLEKRYLVYTMLCFFLIVS